MANILMWKGNTRFRPSHSSSTTMSSNRTLLPQEPFDIIIDEISYTHDQSEWTRGLVDLSLVSKPFRDRAHKHLFASVEINRDNPNTSRTAHQLCKLIQADPFSETSGLASRITSFTYFFQPTDSKPLAVIFRKLFKDQDDDVTHPAPCKLSLYLGTRWLALDKDLSLALFEVCHRSRLESLSISQFQHIPRNFLRNTCIKHLKLNYTSLSEPLPEHLFADITGKGHDQAVILESLDVNVRFSVRSILDISQIPTLQVSPTVIFSKLQRLSFDLIPTNERMSQALEEILQGASSSLQILTVRISQSPIIHSYPFTGRLTNLHVASSALGGIRPLPLRSLPKLHTLVAICHSNSRFFRSCSILLDNEEFCPALQNLELHFDIRLVLLNEVNLIDHLRSLECDFFDGLFVTQPQFDRICFLTFYFVLDSTVPYLGDQTSPEALSSLIRSQFPNISTKRNLDFSVVVTTSRVGP